MPARPLFSFALLFSLAYSNLASAQVYNRSLGDFDDDAPPPRVERDSGAGARMERLEREMRRMTGSLEELQHDVETLKEQLRAARQDALREPSVKPAPSVAVITPSGAAAGSTTGSIRRGDAFDPAENPGAAGAPRPLGSTQPTQPLSATASASRSGSAREVGAPLDLTQGRLRGDANATAAPGPSALLGGEGAEAGVKDDYDHAMGLLRSGQYETAEKGFSDFLARNPKSKLASSATFNLAESYFLRGRHREAAEKYLEISTKYAQSNQAPEAMLRLGQSLHALGAREQACASFSELSVKYPNASAKLKDAALRESKKIQC